MTRARDQAAGLLERLAAEGAEAIAFPCLEFAPASDEQRQALERALHERERFAGVIVSSQNGADALGEALARLELDSESLANMQLVAIGSGTAERLRSHGLRVDLLPEQARGEGLVAALAQRGLLGARWLQIRADEGRELLGDAIARAGGQLELIVGYRTVRPAIAPALLDALRPIEHGGLGYHAICFASGRTAAHFLATTGAAYGHANARAWLKLAKVVVIGPVTADAITKLGVRVDAIAAQPSEAGLLAAVRACLAPPSNAA